VSSTDGVGWYTAVCDSSVRRGPSRELVDALVGRAVCRQNLGDSPGAADDARRSLALARELGYPAGELEALTGLALCAEGDAAAVRDWARQAQEFMLPDNPGYLVRWSHYILALVLTEAGELDFARRLGAAGLSQARRAGDLTSVVNLLHVLAELESWAGNRDEVAAYLREALGVASRIGYHMGLLNTIEQCGYLCAAAGRWPEAVTLWTAYVADMDRHGMADGLVYDTRREDYHQRVNQVLSPDQRRAAEERGARMTVSAVTELAVMVTTAVQEASKGQAPQNLLTPRERELVTLVAQGHGNAEIATQLYISIRTVDSHLERIRAKTGYRRRADLTRFAIEQSLI
jgi:DNA-binding NarL/FixJ family response regulator